jgi:hypothetical protein
MQTPPNYARALAWTSVMTALAHLEPDFKPIFAIQAVNEPIMDAVQTPGLQECKCIYTTTTRSVFDIHPDYDHFVQVIRVTELALGVIGDGDDQLSGFFNLCAAGDLKTAVIEMSDNDGLDVEVRIAIKSALRILIDLAAVPGLDFPLLFEPVNRAPLTVK